MARRLHHASRTLLGMDPDELARALELEPLPGEGGRFRRTFADERSAAIYYLMIAPDFSALHRLDVTEIWHHYAGAPARLLILAADGTVAEPVLGSAVQYGEQPQIVVPAGAWQAAEPLGEWTLAGCTTAPPFTWEAFALGDPGELAAGWPQAARRIARLAPQAGLSDGGGGTKGISAIDERESNG